MFRDRFIGGPLDGETRDATAETVGTDRVRDRESRIEYVRAPDLDTDTVRAWAVDDTPTGQQGPVISESKTGITLGDLRQFVTQADREGWPDTAMPRSVAGWRLRLHKIELSKRSF